METIKYTHNFVQFNNTGVVNINRHSIYSRHKIQMHLTKQNIWHLQSSINIHLNKSQFKSNECKNIDELGA